MARPTTRLRNAIADAVITLRKSLGETQQQFAFRLGCSVTAVARWETARPPTGATLVKFIELADSRAQGDLSRVFREALAEDLGYNGAALRAAVTAVDIRAGEEADFQSFAEFLRDPEYSAEMEKIRRIIQKRRRQDGKTAYSLLRDLGMVIQKKIAAGFSDEEISSRLNIPTDAVRAVRGQSDETKK